MTTSLKEILNPLDNLLEKVDDDIKIKLTTGIPLLDNTALHLFIKGGKKIRASLVILSSGLYGDVPSGIVEIASATEIVHAATLVHDDIIDQAILRRGDFTVSKKWGNKIAVLSGDFMYTNALTAVVNDGNPDLFPVIVAGTNDMVKGELYQIQYSGIDVINKNHYLNIIELKTAKFMAACTKLGAIKANLSGEKRDKLSEFGLNIGFAFQIIDDTLDFIKNDVTGKDCGNDFKESKVTLPYLYLLENSGENEKKLYKEYITNPDEKNWEIVQSAIMDAGIIDRCMDEAKVYVDRSFEIIKQFPDSQYKKILIDLTKFFIFRSF